MVWRYRLGKLSRLEPTGLLELVQAQLLLIWAWLLVRLVPRGRLLRGRQIGPTAGCAAVGSIEAEVARRLALAVSRAAEHGLFRPTCLVRALAIERFLRVRGIDSGRVRVGVRMGGRGSGFGAHAWVELGDLILGDEEWHVRSFTPVRGIFTEGR